MIREDYVLRLIRQLADAIARIAGFRRRGDFVGARDELGRAWDGLGVPVDLVLALEAEGLADLLGPGRWRAAATLLTEHAEVTQAGGDPLSAAALRLRAIDLLARLRARGELDPEGDVLLIELGRHVPASELARVIERHAR